MPTQSNQLLLTFWLVRPEHDLHTLEQMRAAGEAGVYEPTFTAGERHLLCMVARFDASDENALISAALYAMQNVKMIHGEACPGSHLWGVECYLNGEKLTLEKIPQ